MPEPLLEWPVLADRADWPSLLLGNGASVAVWSRFAYPSLYRVARALPVPNGLTQPDRRVFAAFRTRNFEQVLGALLDGAHASRALNGSDHPAMLDRYRHIRQALTLAVHETHLPWGRAQSAGVLPAFRAAMSSHQYIFTTNYDLLLYWARMEGDAHGFTDFFFSRSGFGGSPSDLVFIPTDTDIWDSKREVFHLHGGLHLYRTPDGRTLKRVAKDDQNLLDLFNQEPDLGAVPLLVTEGRSREKLHAIGRSDYLSYCYHRLARRHGNLTVFGHSLGPSDAHILSAIQAFTSRHYHEQHRRLMVAIAMRPQSVAKLPAEQARLSAALPEADVFFFDATTHPLGSSVMHIG